MSRRWNSGRGPMLTDCAGHLLVKWRSAKFTIVPIPAIDTVLEDHGIDNWRKLMAVSPQQLGHWLDADTVVYGEVLHYDAYYALLIAAWDVGVRVQLVSTRDGHHILEASDNRYSVDLRPS